ncbi:MAG TPA: aminotransferase class IV family protein [Rhizobiaceae bacterium]|nr:aminotransferase class IV family protein [Rhizobiaceae bacterium]
MPAEGTLRDGQAAGFELIETLRWEPEGGYLRLPLHLARLQDSARELGFAFSEDAAKDALARAASGREPLRVRLVTSRDGACTVAAQAFKPFAPGTVWRLAIAETRLDSDDRLLRHKTTLRQRYDAARAEFAPAAADEVLLLNERGEVCEGTITNVFIRAGGTWLTPPLSSGLLAGVLRAEMLANGRAREAVLTPDDLRAAEALAVGNSLRGLIDVRLA